MADLSELRSAVERDTSVTESAITLLNSLADQIRDAADDPAEVRAIADSINSNTDQLADAVATNTPAQPGAEAPVTEPDYTVPADSEAPAESEAPGDDVVESAPES
jgi:hypothetical protein